MAFKAKHKHKTPKKYIFYIYFKTKGPNKKKPPIGQHCLNVQRQLAIRYYISVLYFFGTLGRDLILALLATSHAFCGA